MKRILVIASFVVAALTPLGQANAHPPYGSCSGDSACNYYQWRWISDVTPAWRFTVGFPAGTWRARALNAVAEWNDQGQPLQWHQVTTDLSNFAYDNCSIQWYQENGIHYGAIDGANGFLARTSICLQDAPAGSGFTYELFSTNIQVDNAENWYTSYLTPGPTQIDLWSVLTHEFGHMSGSDRGLLPNGHDAQGHFDEADNTICGGFSSGTRQTMCPETLPGDTQQRDLEGTPYYHDTHTFYAAY